MFFWNGRNFSQNLAKFRTIRSFSIYTDAYPVQPPDSAGDANRLMKTMIKSLPPSSRLQRIFVYASVRDEDARCLKEGWSGNMQGPGPGSYSFGSCYLFCRNGGAWRVQDDLKILLDDEAPHGVEEYNSIDSNASTVFYFDDADM